MVQLFCDNDFYTAWASVYFLDNNLWRYYCIVVIGRHVGYANEEAMRGA